MASTKTRLDDQDQVVKQPNSNNCFVCGVKNESGLGMKFYEHGPGDVTATYEAPQHYQGYPGVVHGGIIAAMLDEIAGRAAMTGKHEQFRYSAKLEIRYRKPVPTGEPLLVHGWVVEQRASRALARADLRLEDGTLLSEAEALLVNLPDSVDEDQLTELGWRVYPD